MSFLEEKFGWEPELNRGLIASVVFHIVFLAAVYFGVPNLFASDVIVEPLGIKAALVSDITAAPKVDKAGKPTEKPKKQVQKVEPKKPEAKPKPAQENPQPAAAAPPPPTPVEEKVVALPDKEKPKEPEEKEKKKPEEKKAEEKTKKKPEDKKKEEKSKKPDSSELDTLLASVLNEPAAEPTPEPTKKQPAPEPVEPTTGPQTDLISEIPMTASDEDGIRDQIQKNWNLGSAAGAPNLEQILVELRIELMPDGTVTQVTLLNNQADPYFRSLAESAIRAVRFASPLKIPQGKYWPSMKLRFRPSEVM